MLVLQGVTQLVNGRDLLDGEPLGESVALAHDAEVLGLGVVEPANLIGVQVHQQRPQVKARGDQAQAVQKTDQGFVIRRKIALAGILLHASAHGLRGLHLPGDRRLELQLADPLDLLDQAVEALVGLRDGGAEKNSQS